MKNNKNFNYNNKCNNCKKEDYNFNKNMNLFERITELQFKIDCSVNIINQCIVDLYNVIRTLKDINGKV